MARGSGVLANDRKFLIVPYTHVLTGYAGNGTRPLWSAENAIAKLTVTIVYNALGVNRLGSQPSKTSLRQLKVLS
jgi:hypothetical protein